MTTEPVEHGESEQAAAARRIVIGTAMLGSVMIVAGGVLAWSLSKRIHDVGRLSFDTTGSKLGLVLVAIGVVMLMFSLVAVAVSLGTRMAQEPIGRR